MEAICLVLLIETLEFHVHGAVIADICFHLSRKWQVVIRHVYCESNYCVDALAKKGAYQGEKLLVWQSPLPNLYNFLLVDCMGMLFIRC